MVRSVGINNKYGACIVKIALLFHSLFSGTVFFFFFFISYYYFNMSAARYVLRSDTSLVAVQYIVHYVNNTYYVL